MALIDAFISLTNMSLSLSFSADYWRPITIVSIPRSSNSIALTKRFRPIVLKSFGLQLTEDAWLKRLRPSRNLPDDPFNFAYKLKRSTLDSVAFLLTIFISP